MENSIEKEVVDAILERAADTITIDGVEYAVGSPTPATIIMISELIPLLPNINPKADNIFVEVLRFAKDASVIGRIAATLILGAKRIKQQRKVAVNGGTEYYTRWSWRKFRKTVETRNTIVERSELDYLAERLLEEVSSETLLKVTARQLGLMQINDFFELTTFLSEANRIKPTREVETVSGD